VVTLSGNDACVVLAEGLAGTEAEYVAAMNRMAKKIGLTGSRFANTNGWPHPDEYVTPKDLAIIAERTIRDFPELYARFYGKPSFTWGKTLNGGVPITQANRDPLLGRVQGADGLKTGHTEEAGYGFTGSAQQGGRRLVMVVAGLTSFNERIAASVAFMDWGFRAFRAVNVAKAGKQVQTAEVFGGDAVSVGLVAPRDLIVSAPATAGRVAAKVRYLGPVKAPIAKGQKIADLIVTAPGMAPATFPLVAATAVGEAGPLDRLSANFKRLFGM
jgi:serine-type D-Ala-D-Ala carboxypeptidase (penicillin-binding protein 5/6)